MKYLQSSFTIQSPKKTEGLSCPRCVFGEKWGQHVKGCQNRKPRHRPLDEIRRAADERAFQIFQLRAAQDISDSEIARRFGIGTPYVRELARRGARESAKREYRASHR